jgi:CheY-like chemotaxis protein
MVGARLRLPGTSMPKKILLIENDAATAAELARALEARGLGARVTGDGKEGLDLARDERPDAIVLCVELPRMSGYSVCQKLRKEEGLKSIPLLLTSAEATEETFEAHRKLKARADEYLIKPFTPEALIAKLGRLVELPPAAGEELLTLDDVEELSGEMPLIPPGEKVHPSDVITDNDEDLKLIDEAFDHITAEHPLTAAPGAPARRGGRSTPPPLRPPAPERPPARQPSMARDELDAASALLPAGDETAAQADIDRLGEEADAALAALGAEDTAPVDLEGAAALLDEPPTAPRAPTPEPPRITPLPAALAEPPVRPSSFAIPAASVRQEAEFQRLQGRVSELLIELGRAREDAVAEARAQAEQEAARARAEVLQEAEERVRRAEEARRQAEEGQQAAEDAIRKGEIDAKALGEALHAAEEAQRLAEEQARKALDRAGLLEAEVAALRLRVEETEQAASLKAAQLAEAVGHHAVLGQQLTDLTAQLTEAHAHTGHLGELQAELEAARMALEGHRAEADRRVEELSRRVSELEAVNAKHEERVVKAYQKIKSDEKIREKTRKALAIALQLLDERIGGTPAKEPPEPAPRRE